MIFIDKNMIFSRRKKEGPITRREKINELLEDSLGKKFRGDYKLCVTLELDGWLFKSKWLGRIAKTRWYSFMPMIPGAEIQVGRFLDQSGSRLEILEKFQEEIKEYSRNYKEIFGEDVTVTHNYRPV